MIKKTPIAVFVAALAFAALPSLAMAEETFETTPAASFPSYPTRFTGTSGLSALFRVGSSNLIYCKKDTFTGSFENAHTGTVSIHFTECTESALGTKCTSPGAPEKGTITTEPLKFHTVYLKPTNAGTPHETPGLLITPNGTTGKFYEYECAGGLVKIVVKGNGVLGSITEPAIGGSGTMATLNVNATATGQQYTETVEGKKFGLEANQNGGAFGAAYLNSAEDTLTFEQEGTTTTETP